MASPAAVFSGQEIHLNQNLSSSQGDCFQKGEGLFTLLISPGFQQLPDRFISFIGDGSVVDGQIDIHAPHVRFCSTGGLRDREPSRRPQSGSPRILPAGGRAPASRLEQPGCQLRNNRSALP